MPDDPAPTPPERPTEPPPTESSWTLGPAKTGAAGFLGGAALIGMVWAISTRGAPPPAVRRAAPPPASFAAPSPAPTGAQAGTALAARPVQTPGPDGLVPAPLPPSTRADSTHVPTPSSIDLVVAINHATSQEIQLLPGIGPVLADRIVAHREQSGRFRSIYDLQRVRGIGPRTAETIKDHVTFE